MVFYFIESLKIVHRLTIQKINCKLYEEDPAYIQQKWCIEYDKKDKQISNNEIES